MTLRAGLVCFVLALFCVGSLAYAAEKAQEAEAPPNPVAVVVEDFTKTFNEGDKRHFYVMYSNYNITKVVETVRGDVGIAIASCSAAHPPMKNTLEARYTSWKSALDPEVERVKANVDNMKLAQDYAAPKEIEKIFALVDEARAAKDHHEKIPVSSKEACENLLETMDDNQAQLLKLLQGLQASVPQTP